MWYPHYIKRPDGSWTDGSELRKSDVNYPSVEVVIAEVAFSVPVGVIFCEECELDMTRAEEQCIGGDAHRWPQDWRELCRRLRG